MKFYAAAIGLDTAELYSTVQQSVLVSYAQESRSLAKYAEHFSDIFLDSGAFSAYHAGVKIDVKDYSSFIQNNLEHIKVYANLDVIYDAEGTKKNQQYLESAGLKPLPVFHMGEDISFLNELCDSYDYVALGGMALAAKARKRWLEVIFSNYPKHKFHGFGMTDLSVMAQFPFYTIDSTSWLSGEKFGNIMLPDADWVHWSEITPEHEKIFNSIGISKERMLENKGMRGYNNLIMFNKRINKVAAKEYKQAAMYRDVREELEC